MSDIALPRTVAAPRSETSPPEADGAEGAALLEMARAYQLSQALYVAARLGLADLLAEGPRTSHDLAGAAGADPEGLHRLMRLLASRGLLHDAGRGAFALAGAARLLRRDVLGSVRDQVLLWGDPMQWRPWGELEDSVRTGRPAFDRLFEMGHWAYLAAHPAADAMFKAAMAAHPSHLELPAAYDFTGLREVVDIGGGNGRLLSALLRAHPDLQGVLLDQAGVVADACDVLAAAGVLGRCRLVGGDFFADMPMGADAYLLSNVLMDWDDPAAVRLLRRARDAMGEGAVLLVVERMIPEDNAPGLAQLGDVMGLVITGGRMRTATDYARLFALAGLRTSGSWETPAGYTVLEARPPARVGV